jgi:hypothetical protein
MIGALPVVKSRAEGCTEHTYSQSTGADIRPRARAVSFSEETGL